MSKSLFKGFKGLFGKDSSPEQSRRVASADGGRVGREDSTLQDDDPRLTNTTKKVNASRLDEKLLHAQQLASQKNPMQEEAGMDLRPTVSARPATSNKEPRKEADFYQEEELQTDARTEKMRSKPPEATCSSESASSRKTGDDGGKGDPSISDSCARKKELELQPSVVMSKKKTITHSSMDDSDIYCIAGIANIQAGRFDDAISDLKRSLEWDHNEMICQLLIGICYFKKGTAVRAINHFKAGLHVDGITKKEALPFYVELGKTYEYLKDFQEAIYYYAKVVKINTQYTHIQSKIESLKAGTG